MRNHLSHRSYENKFLSERDAEITTILKMTGNSSRKAIVKRSKFSNGKSIVLRRDASHEKGLLVCERKKF